MIDQPSPHDPGAAGGPSLLNQIEALLRLGGLATAGLTRATLRAAMPMLEILAGVRAIDEGGDQAGVYGFTRREIAVLTRLATKTMLESIEIASITDPVYKGAPAYVARVDGQWQEPHVVHLLALWRAVNRLLDDDQDGEGNDPDGGKPAPDKTVVYLSVAPGEFVAPGPMQPTEIRRMAMRQRALSRPQPAMLLRGSNPARLVAAPQATGPIEAGYGWAQSTGVAAAPTPAKGGCGCRGGEPRGCGCGGDCHGGCRCEHCGRNHDFAPARLDKDGNCAPWLSVSCDTRWRIRECFKVAFCEALRCLGDEICDADCRVDRKSADPGRCVETFICTLLGCLPDAICPPCEPAPAVCAPPLCEPDCRRNFAVGG